MNKLLAFLALAPLAFGQTQLGPRVFSSGTYANRPSSPATGTVYIVTDHDCAGSNSGPTNCRYNGSTWDALGGGGTFSQTNSLGSGGGTGFQRIVDANYGSVCLSSGTFTYPGGTAAAAAATSQEFTIITSLTGDERYELVLLSEGTIFTQGASVTLLKASVGRPGASTNDELMPQTLLMQSSGNAWFGIDRPQPPVLGTANTYTLVLALRTTGGNVSDLTAGCVNYEVYGWKRP